MEGDPVAVGLQFGFLAVLYLFLLLIARSALKDLRGGGSPTASSGLHEVTPGRVAATEAWLAPLRGGGLEPGERIDLFGGVTIGRGTEADLRIEDRFASGVHCRVASRGNAYYLEDLGSTNGTYLNDELLNGKAELKDLDEIRIGDTELRFEFAVPEGHG